MKKIVVAFLLSIGLTQVVAADKFGVGLAFSGDVALAGQYSGDVGTINVELSSGSVTADYLFLEGNIDAVKGLSYYVGAGAGIGYSGSIGVRVPLGLDFNINDEIDVFVQYVPGLSIIPAFTGNYAGYTAGARYFF